VCVLRNCCSRQRSSCNNSMQRSCHVCVYKVQQRAGHMLPRSTAEPTTAAATSQATSVHACGSGRRAHQQQAPQCSGTTGAHGAGPQHKAGKQRQTPAPTTTIPSGHSRALGETGSCVASGKCSSSRETADTTRGRCAGGHLHGQGSALLLAGLVDEGLVDVGDDTTTGDGGLQKKQCVQTRRRRSGLSQWQPTRERDEEEA
jgi:hypothetical protein